MSVIKSIINGCPKDVEIFVEDLFAICMNLAAYDPNYYYDDDAEM